MQMQPVIQIIIHIDVTPFLTHEQANQCNCAFVGGPFRKSYMKINTKERRLLIKQAYFDRVSVGDGVDQGIKVERWQVRILCLNEHHIWGMVPAEQQD